jgi:hypothetical protein
MPVPPVTMIAVEPLSTWIMYVSVAMVALGLFVSLRFLFRTGNPIPLFIGVGGAIASLLEPLYDITAMIWHPTVGQWTAFTLFDRQIPMFIPWAWCWNVGFASALFWYCFYSGRLNAGNIWWWYAGSIAINALFEVPGTSLNVYTYYGNQPLAFTPGLYGAPIGFLNGASEIGVAFIAWRVGPYFQRGVPAWTLGWFITPLGYFASSGPGWIPVMMAATSSGWSKIAIQTMGLVSIVLSVATVWLIKQMLASHGPEAAVLEASPCADPRQGVRRRATSLREI